MSTLCSNRVCTCMFKCNATIHVTDMCSVLVNIQVNLPPTSTSVGHCSLKPNQIMHTWGNCSEVSFIEWVMHMTMCSTGIQQELWAGSTSYYKVLILGQNCMVVHLKACPHWTPNVHWTRLNPVWAHPHWMRIRLIWTRYRLIPIHFQRWFRSRLNWIAQLHVRTKRVWHAYSCRLLTASVLLWATHCVPCICSTRETIWWLAEVKIWRWHHGTCSFSQRPCMNSVPHNAVWTRSMRIGFALGNSVTEPVWIWIQLERS